VVRLPLETHYVASCRDAVLSEEGGQWLEEALCDKVAGGDEGGEVGDELVVQGRGVGEDGRVVFEG
jgi:hypothetical protein